jgi:hypothetical protein
MTWEVGDLVVCVDDAPHPTYGRAIVERGCTYHVIGVVTAPNPHVVFGGRVGLLLKGVDADAPWGFSSRRFRKIRPDAHEGNVEDWNLILETTKRKVRA